MKERQGSVEENREIASGYFSLIVSGDFPTSSPGQFAMVSVSDTFEPFLRRPFGIADQGNNWIRFIYKVQGRGTELLSRLKKGEVLSLITPLGKGFFMEKGRVLLVAGGTGIAPLLYLAQNFEEFVLLYGAKTKSALLREEVEKIIGKAHSLIYTTEDGSYGLKGLLTSHIPEEKFSMAYVAGPYKMMKEFSRIYSGEAQFSFEERMGCGFGVCYSCVVRVKREGKEEYVRSCKEGPVFFGKEVVWI